MQLDVKKLETKQDIDYIENELSNNVDNAISDVNSDRKTNLGKVSRFIANRVKRLFGIDVSNRQHVLFDNDIRHMLNEHGNPYTEKQKGQIAITSVDIKNIPNIINNPDVITKGSDARNKLNSIRYIKRIDNNTITVAEIIPNKGSLQIKTMWKKLALADDLTPAQTFETQGKISSTSDSTIAHTNSTVNSSNMQ